MRPINLKIQGINSYVSEQEVDFQKLAENSLFGVFGETGSGKTTILDAIVIALYGSSDREIIQNIINVNCKQAHIYFTFEVGEEKPKKYLVKREYKVRASGVKSDAILTDLKGTVYAEQTEQVNDKILSIIGIGKKEFLKCIALPQGEFDRFLVDTPANRKKTIAKLFDLESFGVQLQEKIKLYKDKINIAQLNLNEKINMFGDASDERLDELRKTLNLNRERLNTTVQDLNNAKSEFETLKSDFEKQVKLIDLNAKLGKLKAESGDIEYVKQQVSFTKKYGEFILLSSKAQDLNAQINELTEDLKADRDLLLRNEDSSKDFDAEIALKTEKLNAINAKLNIVNENIKLFEGLNKNKEDLVNLKESIEEQIELLKKAIKENKDLSLNAKIKAEQKQKELHSLLKAQRDNEDVLDKIKEAKTVKTIESFVDYLSFAKNIVTTEALQEVYQYDIYKEVNKLLDSLNDYEEKSRKQVVNIRSDYDVLATYNSSIEDLEKKLSKTNREYLANIEKIKKDLEEASAITLVNETSVAEKTETMSTLKVQLNQIKTKLKIVEEQIDKISDVKDYEKLSFDAENLNRDLLSLNARKNELLKEYGDVIVSIEVGTIQLADLKEQLNQINKQMKKYKIDNDKIDEVIDKNLYLNALDLEKYELKVNDYDKEYYSYITQINDLKLNIRNEYVDKDLIKLKQQQIENLTNEEKNLNVEIALCGQLIEQTKQSLITIDQLKKQKAELNKQMDVVLELSKLTSNNKLLDYVSEEYMQLITQFSNKFVYEISKKKYLLKYTGEFYVIDNFNGGISRSVKTLSGGERFIVSLSLALGISQSIAINNNKRFNFFFIDEGFGSLSDEYIETVLNSFDALIKLNFTVGFITHVEKMQQYINNRIVVTKKDNEEGSIIKQYS